MIHNPHESKSTNDLKLIVYDSISLNDEKVKGNDHFPPIAMKSESQKLCSSTYNVLTHCGSFNERSNNITPSNTHKYDVVLPIDEDTSTSTINTPADEDTHQYNKLFMFSEGRQSEDTTSAYASIKLLTSQQLIMDNSSIPDDKVHVHITPSNTHKYDVVLEDTSTSTINTPANEDTHQYNKLFMFSEERQSEDTTSAYASINLLTGQQLIMDNSSIPDDKVHVPALVNAVTTTSYETTQPLSTGDVVSASSIDEVIQHEYDIILVESSKNDIDENTIGAYSVVSAECM